jgi:threonine synthase
MTGSSDSNSLIVHLECSQCKKIHDHRNLQTVCAVCGKSLLVRYDLDAARRTLKRDDYARRPFNLWRGKELLPVIHTGNMITLGEGGTPLTRLKNIGRTFGISDVRLKDESSNATGSFKARGLAMAVAKAKELGVQETCVPTAGNAGGALAAYAAAARIKAHVYMPEDSPQVNIVECRLYGADVHLVRGLISDAAKAMVADKGDKPWFDVSTLKEPYRLEGKKTIGFEVAEQYGWRLPDVIVYPTGGGTGLIGMWKAFDELEALGWIDSRRPKMVSVQSSGCAPIVRAYESGARVSEFWEGAETVASGLRVPKAFADTLILDAIYASGGCAVAVTDGDILATMRMVARKEGLLLCPEGAATIAALPLLRKNRVIEMSSSVLAFNTGSGLKYMETMSAAASQS